MTDQATTLAKSLSEAEVAAQSLTPACKGVLKNLSEHRYMSASEAGGYPATMTRLRCPPVQDDLTLLHMPLVTTDVWDCRRVFKLSKFGAEVRSILLSEKEHG